MKKRIRKISRAFRKAAASSPLILTCGIHRAIEKAHCREETEYEALDFFDSLFKEDTFCREYFGYEHGNNVIEWVESNTKTHDGEPLFKYLNVHGILDAKIAVNRKRLALLLAAEVAKSEGL